MKNDAPENKVSELYKELKSVHNDLKEEKDHQYAEEKEIKNVEVVEPVEEEEDNTSKINQKLQDLKAGKYREGFTPEEIK